MSCRILALPYGHALSHVSRPLALAEALRERGHEVVFSGGGKELAHAARRGFEVREILELPHDLLFGRIRAKRLRFVEAEELWSLVEADRKVLSDVKPDLLLSDGRLSARLSARAEGVRHAAVVNVSSTRHRAVPYAPLFDWLPGESLRRALVPFNLWFEMALFDWAVPAFRRAEARLGLPPTATATDCLEGNDLTLLPDVPAFMPSRGLPKGHVYIGPLTFRSDLPEPPWWPQLLEAKRAGRKVVYFTLGTTGTRELFQSMVGFLAGRQDLVAVVSTGGQVEIPNPPPNVFVDSYLDGERVMHEADLVVCHGGNGTIYQDLSAGVPVVCLPTIPDQNYNARRVEALGLGATWNGTLGPEFASNLPRWFGLGARRAWEKLQAGCPSPGPGLDALEALGRGGRP